MCKAQTRVHSASNNFSEPCDFLWSIWQTLAALPALSSISFFWASSISFWNLSWMSFSAKYFTLCVHQPLKTVCKSTLSFFDARPMSTPFDFSFCSLPKVLSRMFSFSSSILPSSVSRWHRLSRAMRLLVLASQLSWISRISPTSMVASMIVCLRIWELTPWSPSSMIRATSSGGPSSRAQRTREAADITSWSCSAKCSKVLRTSSGIFFTTASMNRSSSSEAKTGFSSLVTLTPCSSKRSSAATAHLSRSQSLAKPE
mmetsp:Transcript_100472/g.279823  ORF Transcript_100472/g.279823 Transcript_100472/m.279823 type:complete len:258 (+) Transcript_100472:985-1758(+)